MHELLEHLQLSAAVAVAKTVAIGSRLTHRGGGTATPGLAAARIDPGIVTKITRELSEGVVVVAGTNGKTTTSRLLADILGQDGLTVAHNRTGSNLVRGVASALARQSSVRGRINADIAVLEADEAAFPELVRMTDPRVVLINNLFRDQLDRYGELNAIASQWEPVLSGLDESTTIVVNGDDPGLVGIAECSKARVVYFGIDPGRYALRQLPHAADAAVCRHCGADLQHEVLSVSHLGRWFCPGCSWRRPEVDVEGTEIQLNGTDSIDLTIRAQNGERRPLHVNIPGLYNAYNVVAAAAAASALGCSPEAISAACASFSAPFGRVEKFTVKERVITLALVKNPVGFNEMLRMFSAGPAGLKIPALIAINDLDADGRDVSWLWDVDFEILADGGTPISTTGIRGADMANRLKYAGVGLDRLSPGPVNLRSGLYGFVTSLPEGGQGCVLATYTAMIELRQVLVDDGLAQAYWEE